MAERSPNARWVTIDGRRWRASDPSIPAALRQELVDELMDARRAVLAAMRDHDADRERAARHRVLAAKVALGERGPSWWDDLSDKQLAPRAEAAIEALTRHRAPDRSTCPSDVARVIDGRNWRRRMDLVRHVAADMADGGTIEVTQRGSVVERGWRGPVRLRATEAD